MSLRRELSRIASSMRRKRRSIIAGAQSLQVMQLIDTQACIESWRDRHAGDNPLLRFGRKHFSQNDEDGLIEEILRRIRGQGPGTFLELGVGDGAENNTLNLLASGWHGAWLGGEALRFAETGPRLTFRRCWIDRDNVAALARDALRAQGIESPDVLSIDLDGNDFHFCQALLASGLRPALWVLEYNARFGAGSEWVMPYDPQHRWDGSDYFGASLAAFQNLMHGAGYRLVACNVTGANAFFVRQELTGAFQELPSDWRRLYMPPGYVQYPWLGHRPSPRTIESIVRAP